MAATDGTARAEGSVRRSAPSRIPASRSAVRPRPWGCAPALAVLVVALTAFPARADRTSGTWTGALEVRGNYYWEESTRVVAPAIDTELEAPNGLLLNGHYLVDTITSASLAAGTNEDVAFTEVRHDVGLGVGYELDFGAQQLELGADSRYSYEPDYWSAGAGLNAALSLNQRTTTLRTSVFYIYDNVGRMVRGSARSGPAASSIGTRRTVGTLEAVAATFVWDQVLSPTLTAQVGYDLNYMTGFLANAYRRVAVEGTPKPESHPDTRWRHAVTGRLAWYIRSSGTALHTIYRSYLDSWDIGALTPEVRVYQELGTLTQLRLRYRYYTQTEAFFYEADNSDYAEEAQFVSADPKMSEFHSQLAGIQLLLLMDFLADTPLGFLRESTIDMSFDYVWNTNRYGNAVISQIGMRMPF